MTAYEVRSSDGSSDVCSSDLVPKDELGDVVSRSTRGNAGKSPRASCQAAKAAPKWQDFTISANRRFRASSLNIARIWRPFMPTSHDLKGLMKFLSREEWRECFDEVFYDHFGPVLDAGDMDFEDIAEILGEVWAMTLGACSFEDFLPTVFEVWGGNIFDENIT